MNLLRSRTRSRTVLRTTMLETRLAPALLVVDKLGDYDPTQYKPDDPLTFLNGSLRYAVQYSLENGGAVTFNTNPANGVDFDDPLNPQTILLNYGEISITDTVHILAPRYDKKDDSLPLVEINLNSFLNDEDRSVFNIEIAKTSTDGRHPIYSPSVRLNGLRITGGESKTGGGVYAKGFFDLYIQKTEISGNMLDNDDPADPKTTGAGIAAMSMAIDKDVEFRDVGQLYYGPRVRIEDSVIIGNATDTNDDDDMTPVDQGGGIYLDKGASLYMTNSVVSGNSAENGAAGIYFAGGQHFENLTGLPGQQQYAKLFTTELRIVNSIISDNIIGSLNRIGSGGGLVVVGPTFGMIADTTFIGNKARQDGGGIQFTGFGENNHTRFVGAVHIYGTTFEANRAATILEGEDPLPFGSGGALAVEGIVNHVFVVNSTISGNQTMRGEGGGVVVRPRTHTFSRQPEYKVDYEARTITLTLGQDWEFPPEPDYPTYPFQSSLGIYNTTIADNTANGKELGNPLELTGARGGGIAIITERATSLPGHVFLHSTIIGDNHVSPTIGFGPDIWVADDDANPNTYTFIPGKHNLIENNASGEFLLDNPIIGDPQLWPLDDYGGPTKTRALKSNSPAIDRGDADVKLGTSFKIGTDSLTLTQDQRGYLREVEYILNDSQYEPRADIGSYELPASFLPHVVSVVVNDGEQPGQQSMIWNIAVTFSETVTVTHTVTDPAFLVERTKASGNEQFNTTGAVNINFTQPAGNKIVITFATSGSNPIFGVGNPTKASLPDGIYSFKIFGEHVASTVTVVGGPPALATLDVNGDGIGDNTDVYELKGAQENNLFRLFGDGDGNGKVDNYDFALFRATMGLNNQSPAFNAAFDYDGDGLIGTADFAQFRARFGITLLP